MLKTVIFLILWLNLTNFKALKRNTFLLWSLLLFYNKFMYNLIIINIINRQNINIFFTDHWTFFAIVMTLKLNEFIEIHCCLILLAYSHIR